MLIGDNLSAHALGGFLESFGPNVNKICRYCNCCHDNIHKDFECSSFQKRTEASYNSQCETVELCSSYSTAYSLKRRSEFNQLHYFLVIMIFLKVLLWMLFQI